MAQEENKHNQPRSDKGPKIPEPKWPKWLGAAVPLGVFVGGAWLMGGPMAGMLMLGGALAVATTVAVSAPNSPLGQVVNNLVPGLRDFFTQGKSDEPCVAQVNSQYLDHNISWQKLQQKEEELASNPLLEGNEKLQNYHKESEKLLGEARELLDAKQIDSACEKMKEVEVLQKQFESQVDLAGDIIKVTLTKGVDNKLEVKALKGDGKTVEYIHEGFTVDKNDKGEAVIKDAEGKTYGKEEIKNYTKEILDHLSPSAMQELSKHKSFETLLTKEAAKEIVEQNKALLKEGGFKKAEFKGDQTKGSDVTPQSTADPKKIQDKVQQKNDPAQKK